jgi:hypothetical protein
MWKWVGPVLLASLYNSLRVKQPGMAPCTFDRNILSTSQWLWLREGRPMDPTAAA